MATNVYTRAVDFTIPGSTGLFDVTADLGGYTPKAVMFVATYYVTSSTPGVEETGGYNMSVGFTDGVASKCMHSMGRSGLGNSSSLGVLRSDLCIMFSFPTTALGATGAAFSSFITNGVRLNFTAVGEPGHVTAIFFFGDDLQAKVGVTGLGNSASTTTVNTVGFEGDLGVFLHLRSDEASANVGSTGMFSLGFAANGGNQGCSVWTQAHNVASGGNPSGAVVDTYAISGYNVGTGVLDYTGTVGNWTSSGFDIVMNAAASNWDTAYLILKFGDLAADVFTFDTATATGTEAHSEPGFFPQFVMTSGLAVTSLNSYVLDDPTAASWNVSCFDRDDFQSTHLIRSRSTADPTDNGSTFAETALQVADQTTNNDIVATNDGMTADGWSYTYSAVAASPQFQLGFAIEAGDPIPSFVGFTFGDFTDDTFVDWSIDDGVGANYDSYLHTFYQAVEDEMYFMQAPYVYVYLENQSPNTDEAPAETESLILRGAWDWSNSVDSAHWSTPQQVYNYRANNLVAVARRKIRGRGRVLQLRFESEPSMDFKLLGWGLTLGKNTGP